MINDETDEVIEELFESVHSKLMKGLIMLIYCILNVIKQIRIDCGGS